MTPQRPSRMHVAVLAALALCCALSGPDQAAGQQAAVPAAPAVPEQKVIRLGMIGLDTSHVIAFTRYLNNPKNNSGCRVVAGYPGGSPDFKSSADRVQGFTDRLRTEHGLEIVESIEELCQKVDGVMLESVDGRPHLDQATRVIAAGKPPSLYDGLIASIAVVNELILVTRNRADFEAFSGIELQDWFRL